MTELLVALENAALRAGVQLNTDFIAKNVGWRAWVSKAEESYADAALRVEGFASPREALEELAQVALEEGLRRVVG